MLLYGDSFDLKDVSLCNNNFIIVRLQYKQNNHTLVVVTVYIPPGDKNDKLLENLIRFIDSFQNNEDIALHLSIEMIVEWLITL